MLLWYMVAVALSAIHTGMARHWEKCSGGQVWMRQSQLPMLAVLWEFQVQLWPACLWRAAGDEHG